MLNLSLFKHAVIAAALLLPACFANAHEYKSGDLQITHPWSQELPPNAPTVAAYFVIHNTGSTADRLLSAETPIAGGAELHQHVMQGDMMRMQPVTDVVVAARWYRHLCADGVPRDDVRPQGPQPAAGRQAGPVSLGQVTGPTAKSRSGVESFVGRNSRKTEGH